jgi:metal-dependent amidase/aminoacylase/carboxypeptidase family protein
MSQNDVVIDPTLPTPTGPVIPEPLLPAAGRPDPAKLQQTITLVMKVAAGVAKMTSYTFDDAVVAFVTPIVTAPEFADFLADVIAKFKGVPPARVVGMLPRYAAAAPGDNPAQVRQTVHVVATLVSVIVKRSDSPFASSVWGFVEPVITAPEFAQFVVDMMAVFGGTPPTPAQVVEILGDTLVMAA